MQMDGTQVASMRVILPVGSAHFVEHLSRAGGWRHAAGLSGGHRPALQKSQQAGNLFAGQARGPSSCNRPRQFQIKTLPS
jgi:hypothetical protein